MSIDIEKERALLPRSDSEDAASAINGVLAERSWPCSPQAAARAGFEAAFRLVAARASQPKPDPVTLTPDEVNDVWESSSEGLDDEMSIHTFAEKLQVALRAKEAKT